MEKVKNKPERLIGVPLYVTEVLQKMYPKGKKGQKFIDAARQVLANHYITDEAEVSRLLREIGKFMKNKADMKKLAQQAEDGTIEPEVKPQPYEDSFARARRRELEKAQQDNPLFADQVAVEIKQEQERRGF